MTIIKQTVQRGLALLLILCLVLYIPGCGARKGQAEFDQFLQHLPASFVSGNSLDLNFVFENPEDFGIKQQLAELPFTTEEQWNQGQNGLAFFSRQLSLFDPERLDDSSRLTLEILQDYFQRARLTQNYFYLSNNYLGSYLGFQAQLPLLLMEYHFNRQMDLDSYFHILETLEDTFVQYAQMERDRQAAGVGMSQPILDKVMEQCDNLVNRGCGFLVEALEAQLERTDFLSASEREQALQKGASLLTEKVPAAYRRLKQELSSIQGSEESRGLAHMPGGRDYYQALMQQTTGCDMTVEQAEDYLEEQLHQCIEQMQREILSLQQTDPQGVQEFLQNPAVTYSRFTSVEETLDHLSAAMQTEFPDIPNLSYRIITVPDAMKDNFSPAAYLSSRIDQSPEEPQSIYINGAYQQSLFPTIVHEGYPGHMYQDAFFHSLELPAVRSLLHYNGYSEGWATYVENRCLSLAPERDKFAGVYSYNQQATRLILSLSDIGIHYHGWDFAQYQEYMTSRLGSLEEETLRRQYEVNIETPTNYLQYFLTAYLYQDMYDQAEAQLGAQFSPVEFHRVLLSTGPAPVHILQEQVTAWVQRAADPSAKAA